MADPLEASWLPPEFADAARDARALVRCVLDDDDEGARVILDVLEDDSEQARAVALLLAEMTAELLPHCDRHWLAGFVRPEG